jgi:hypothetical protein
MINICAFTLICSTLVLTVHIYLPTYYSSKVIPQVFSLGFFFCFECVSTSIDNVLLCRYKQGMSTNSKSLIDHCVADDY